MKVEIGEAVRNCSDTETEVLIVKLAPMEEAVTIARKFLDEGVEVILGGGGTGSLLAQTLGQPIVKIARTHADIVRALIKAKDLMIPLQEYLLKSDNTIKEAACCGQNRQGGRDAL